MRPAACGVAHQKHTNRHKQGECRGLIGSFRSFAGLRMTVPLGRVSATKRTEPNLAIQQEARLGSGRCSDRWLRGDSQAGEALVPVIADLGVAEAGGVFAAEAFDDVFGGEVGQGVVDLFRVADVVTGGDNARVSPQGVVVSGGLLFPGVDGSALDAAFVEGFDQGGLVDAGAARGVDQVRLRLHEGELVLADEVVGGVAEGDHDGDDVG